MAISIGLTGRKLSEVHKANIRKAVGSGRMSVHWKGDRIGYDALHDWVNKTLGKPTVCARCGRQNKPAKDGRRTIQWANISHKYRRDKRDWMPLCIPCHIKHDRHGKN